MPSEPVNDATSGLLSNVTAVLVTLNEQESVVECLRSIELSGVVSRIVIDASSDDATASLAKTSGAEVHVVQRRGLGSQRQFGVDLVTTDYVLMVDADNRFRPETVATLVYEIERSQLVGVAPRKVANNPRSYWARAWSWHNELQAVAVGPKLVIGTPALFVTKVLQEIRYDPEIRGAADDTDLCLRLAQVGFQVGTSSAVCDEEIRTEFVKFARKTIWYGQGDAEFFRKHPSRRLSISTHPLRNYLVGGSFKAAAAGRIDLVPFYIVYALLRSAGFIAGMAALLSRGKLAIRKT